MPNLSQLKRQSMLAFLDKIKEEHKTDDEMLIALGKTIILIDFVEEYLSKINSNAAFIWLCPGKGDLEEQSRKKMRKFAPHRHTQNLFDALQGGFPAESTTFINWELVTKKDNTSLRDGEKKNLFDRIAEAHHNNTEFIVIIDEEHSNNTAKAKTIIEAFSAKNIIRVSDTVIPVSSISSIVYIDGLRHQWLFYADLSSKRRMARFGLSKPKAEKAKARIRTSTTRLKTNLTLSRTMLYSKATNGDSCVIKIIDSISIIRYFLLIWLTMLGNHLKMCFNDLKNKRYYYGKRII